MNDFSISALTSDQLDELLSSHIDGELDAAAADFGFDPAVVRHAIQASPAAQIRLAQLGIAARALQTEGKIELEEIRRHRLVKSTLGHVPAVRSTRNKRSAAVASGLAVAAAIIAGVIISTQPSSKTRASKQSMAIPSMADPLDAKAAERGAETQTPTGPGVTALGPPAIGVAEFGSIADEADLRSRVFAAATKGSGSATSYPRFTNEPEFGRSCLVQLPDAGSSTDVEVIAHAQYRGLPAAVAVGTVGSNRRAWLFRASNCTVLITILQ